jgi:hypothetical protein
VQVEKNIIMSNFKRFIQKHIKTCFGEEKKNARNVHFSIAIAYLGRKQHLNTKTYGTMHLTRKKKKDLKMI